MKTHSSEEIDLSTNSNNFAADQNWQRSMRQPAEDRQAQVGQAQGQQTHDQQAGGQQAGALSNFAAVVALLIAFCTLVLLSLRASPPPSVADNFELQLRPIWISTVPYAPRDGLVPDFGQPNYGQSSFVQPLRNPR
jgi:hypothetical protein